MKMGKSLQDLAAELQRQNVIKKDYLADTSEMNMTIAEASTGNRRPVLSLSGLAPFEINENTHTQIATKLGIPVKYYDRMGEEEPELLAENVNRWFHKYPQKRMVRTLDGTARAFLSDKYRRIDNHQVAEAVFPIISQMEGARIDSCEITDNRMYLKVVNPRVETEIRKGDVVQSGILISNSEVGLGAISVMPLVFRLVCLNGMIAADAGQRRQHIGRINEADDGYQLFRSETIAADDKAFIMKLQDIVQATADSVQFERIVNAMRDSTERKITGAIPSVVELTAKTFGLVEGEQKGVLDYLIRGGDLSLYGLANAVTEQAQQVLSYDRSTDLEMTAWDIMTMPKAKWAELNAV